MIDNVINSTVILLKFITIRAVLFPVSNKEVTTAPTLFSLKLICASTSVNLVTHNRRVCVVVI